MKKILSFYPFLTVALLFCNITPTRLAASSQQELQAKIDDLDRNIKNIMYNFYSPHSAESHREIEASIQELVMEKEKTRQELRRLYSCK